MQIATGRADRDRRRQRRIEITLEDEDVTRFEMQLAPAIPADTSEDLKRLMITQPLRADGQTAIGRAG